MDDGDESGWSRSEWARWWLDHNEVDEAARVLEPGDVVAPLPRTDFLDLEAALTRRGLTALYEDRSGFVYTLEQARRVLAEIALDDAGAVERRPPARAGAPRAAPAHKKTA